MGNEWLEFGNCLIAKTTLKGPTASLHMGGVQVSSSNNCRAAIARTTLAKNLRAQPLPAKILEMGLLGMAANVPLCSWREHTSMFLKECLASGTYQFHSQQCSGRESHLDAKISHGLYYSRIRPGPGGSRAEIYRLSAVAER
ncbi:hypothetical protein SAY86_001622 [Trapa natans]|uniref:Uncharacterized protein n=1 Tax=Trapa natans TaxID=22666 RepID=A0AAN7LBU4_TRANT|nr:hypothetical protein SAY86_001622 [Trapa natans]